MTQPFSAPIQKAALARQGFHCACCAAAISAIGEGARGSHPFGERAEAHHVIPHKLGGPNTVANCVVICQACHLNAHQGGRWSDISIYDDLRDLAIDAKIEKIAAEYCHYNGHKPGCDCGLDEPGG